ncbi:MAG: hypothetical protein ACE367_25080 [Acidimicrobiales bacterium]
MTTIVALLATLVPAAAAEDRIYWPNFDGGFDSIGSANLDGSGGGSDFRPGGGSVFGPSGLVFDTAAGRMYWANTFDNTIWGAPIDESGTPTQVNTAGANTGGVSGLAIDVAAGRLYWAASVADVISYAHLDGTGGGTLATGAATLDDPLAVAIDPVGGRIYWTNFAGDAISFAALDGSGGGDLVTPPGPVSGPVGIAIHRGLDRVYWTNATTDSIASATLAGGDARTELDAMDGVPDAPFGLAIDEENRSLYWAGFSTPSTIARTTLDDGGGAAGVQVLTTDDVSPATLIGPYAVAVLRRPVSAAPPVVTGAEQYTCSTGTWETDRPGANLYRGPTIYGYQWLLDGNPIAGATAELHVPAESGEYRCQVTAINHAGEATQLSEAATVTIAPDTVRPTVRVTATAKVKKSKKFIRVKVRVSIESNESCRARITATGGFGRKIKFTARNKNVEADQPRKVNLTGKVKRSKAKKGKVKVKVACTDDAGNRTTVTKKGKLEGRAR